MHIKILNGNHSDLRPLSTKLWHWSFLALMFAMFNCNFPDNFRIFENREILSSEFDNWGQGLILDLVCL